jgi:hypothetical protein
VGRIEQHGEQAAGTTAIALPDCAPAAILERRMQYLADFGPRLQLLRLPEN